MGAFTPAKLDRAGEAVAQVLEATPDAMVAIGLDGRIVRVNTRAEELFGYTQEELLGQKPDLLIPPQRPRRRDAKRRQAAHQRVHALADDLEVLARRRDGTSFPAEISLSFVEGRAETLVLTAIRDIGRKRAEELHLTAIVEASDDAIIGKTLDGTIVSWNKGADSVSGQIVVEYLPPYAPELNPVEYLWGHWKHHTLPNVCPKDLWQLSEGARRTLRRLRRRPRLITAFWKQSSLPID